MKKIFFMLITLLLLLSLTACMGGGGSGGDAPDEGKNPGGGGNKDVYFRVMVPEGEGFSITSQNPVDVISGGNVSFDVKIDSGYAFVSVNPGTYDAESGKILLENVTKKTTIDFSVKKLDYSTDEKYMYYFNGTEKDTTSVTSGASLSAGTSITVTAGDTYRDFAGWSFGSNALNGGKIISDSREYTFELAPDIAEDGAVYIYANYTDLNVLYYDVNGGTVYTNKSNTEDNEYYKAEKYGSDKLKVTMLPKYFDYAGVASTFWDDGTFVREGYILKEYNTEPDGSGEGYSLGSKFYTGSVSGMPVLYCIWEEAETAEQFEYADYTYSKPASVKYADSWNESGVIINRYLGNEDTVAIPEKIGGKPVIAIAAGAFTNRNVKTLIMPKTLLEVANGAFTGCAFLETLYFPNSIYSMEDEAFDAQTYSNFKNLIVNATMAPRFSNTNDGAFAVKLCKLMANEDRKTVIVISGSSTYQSMGTEYFEALLDGEYAVINFGTTRPRPGMVYLEALAHYTDENDIFIYAPENSAYMYGEKYLSWRMIRDLEGMSNLFRYFDISNYEGYFSSFSELNRDYNYTVTPRRYEDICTSKNTDKNGDYQNSLRENMDYPNYIDSYYITLNERVKSMTEALWNDEELQERDKDWKDPNNTTWISINTPERMAQLNMAINKAKATGAKVYFGFAPADANAVVAEARNEAWLSDYDKLIDDIYVFDGRLGSSADYIFNHKYFYDCAFHCNDYGRTYRTYTMYKHLAQILGLDVKAIDACGTDFDGCLFETGTEGTPAFGVDFLN